MKQPVKNRMLALALGLLLTVPAIAYASDVPNVEISSASSVLEIHSSSQPASSEELTSSSSSEPSSSSISSESSSSSSSSSQPEPAPPQPEPKPKFGISILSPSGWYTRSAKVEIRVEDLGGTGFVSVEAKIERNGAWEDITDDLTENGRAKLSIDENCTVYVAVTDPNGKPHAKSRYIECFDREAPTLCAKLDGKLLRVEANDDLSGVEAVYINGHRLTDLSNDTLDIRVKEYAESDSDKIDVAAIDCAGNKSKTVQVKNPYYKEEENSCKSSASSSQSSAPPANAAASSAASVPPVSSSSSSAPAKTNSATSKPGAVKPAEESKPEKPSTVTPTDGTGNTIENSVKTPAEREFFTVETAEGNIFYIVVDKEKSQNNVYLLNDVTEDDLMGLAKPSVKDAEEHAIPDPEAEPESKPDPAPQPVQPEPEPEEQPAPKSNTGAVVLILFLAIAGAGAAYYFKVLKPRQELDKAEDIEDIDFVEDEPTINEDDDTRA